MFYCGKCGTAIPAGDIYCGKCGEPIDSRLNNTFNEFTPKNEPTNQTIEKHRIKGRSIFLIIAVVGLAVLTILMFADNQILYKELNELDIQIENLNGQVSDLDKKLTDSKNTIKNNKKKPPQIGLGGNEYLLNKNYIGM